MLSEINQGKGWQFPAVNYLDKFRDRPRFFDQVGHQTTYAYTVKSRVEARVTIQEIKSLGVLQTETCH